MGLVSRAFDRLPGWAQMSLGVIAIAAIIYGVARYGLIFLLKVIFSPDL
jgi:hypothetical protein